MDAIVKVDTFFHEVQNGQNVIKMKFLGEKNHQLGNEENSKYTGGMICEKNHGDEYELGLLFVEKIMQTM